MLEVEKQAELDLLLNNFRFFLKFMFFQIYKTEFIIYNFHESLIQELLNIKDGDRVIINAPPRTGKTEIVKHFIAWKFLKQHSGSVIYVSYDQGLVNRKNSEIMDILKVIAERYNISELKMRKNSDGKKEWKNNAQGFIIARGSGNALTGGGCNMLMVIDDPNKPTDRMSKKVLDNRNQVFVSTIRNRIDLPTVPIIIIQQRVASKDLTGFLLNGGTNDTWRHLSYDAVREDGTSICEERLPLSEIDAYKKDAFTYWAQYRQKPLEEIGKMFRREKLKIASQRPPVNQMKIAISVDASWGTTGNDYNAIVAVGYTGEDFYLLEIDNFFGDIDVLLKHCRDMKQKWQTGTFVIEAKANGNATIQILRKEFDVIIITPHTNKVERALKTKFFVECGKVHVFARGLVYGQAMDQFENFPNSDNDDIVDASAQGINWLDEVGFSYTPVMEVRNPTFYNPEEVGYSDFSRKKLRRIS